MHAPIQAEEHLISEVAHRLRVSHSTALEHIRVILTSLKRTTLEFGTVNLEPLGLDGLSARLGVIGGDDL